MTLGTDVCLAWVVSRILEMLEVIVKQGHQRTCLEWDQKKAKEIIIHKKGGRDCLL